MMIAPMAAVLTTLPRWAKNRTPPVPMSTVNKWKDRFEDFPQPVQRITSTMHLYDPDDLEGFMERHPSIGHGRPVRPG